MNHTNAIKSHKLILSVSMSVIPRFDPLYLLFLLYMLHSSPLFFPCSVLRLAQASKPYSFQYCISLLALFCYPFKNKHLKCWEREVEKEETWIGPRGCLDSLYNPSLWPTLSYLLTYIHILKHIDRSTSLHDGLGHGESLLSEAWGIDFNPSIKTTGR